MEQFSIHTKHSRTNVYVGLHFRAFLAESDKKRTVIITDGNILKYYNDDFSEFKVIETPTGEKNKSLETINNIYLKLLEYGIDRECTIIGIGGGIVCDITGFAATTFLRGVKFGFVPTSLLAMADASIGGKNGINFSNLKNIIGTINQPEFIFCDVDFLKTLPDNEFKNGLAEAVKTSLIIDKEFFGFIENNQSLLKQKNKEILEELIQKCIKIKSSIVLQDEYDYGIRRILNLGHTFAHALESLTGISHGTAVSVGISKAVDISVKLGYLDILKAKRIIGLLSSLGLDVSIDIDFNELINALKYDKKKIGNKINFILLKDIGEPVIEPLSINDLSKLY